MQQIKLENKGLIFTMDGTEYEISGAEGVVSRGNMLASENAYDEMKKLAEKCFSEFIKGHTVAEHEDRKKGIIKKVAWSEAREDFIQLQAIKIGERFIVQEYNSNFVFLAEHETEARYYEEIINIMNKEYNIQRGLLCQVLKSGNGDCTNGGISAKTNELYILGCKRGPFHPSDLRECVILQYREIMGEKHVNALPVVYPKYWYMAGGNFIYSGDSRYRDMIGLSYPVSIHDRYEGSEKV